MRTDESGFVIGEREVAEISTYCQIARANSSLLSLSELAQLTSADATEEEFEMAWNGNTDLRSRYRLEGGYVMDEREGVTSTGILEEEEDRRERAEKNVVIATEFAKLCKDQRVKLLAVAGGNSYRSAGRWDDIDIFCVTSGDSLWLFMLKALILARVYARLNRTPPFCFSYVTDEERARQEFGDAKDALFARDALSANVLEGFDFYRSLLLEASWMRRYFPRMYAKRTVERTTTGRQNADIQRRGNTVLNSFLFYTVGNYVKMKAILLNRKYRSRGESSAVFHSRIGKDHCVYESNRYRRLRKMYLGQAQRPQP
jgi:hypothetical protein